eukprot:TRINITY_DN6963_c3_g1_i1.p1 TRINITY_DN6963_c3_g1~~TRINITY_DN6963_c3_g1_i1.p1  ORF type:complete len:284 (-),score=56.83 TRINITY_DN6963_c3_g1_i1:31-828(-)
MGGSCITNKEEKDCPNMEILDKIIIQIKEALSNKIRVILVHGAGSYGHIVAKEYEVSSGFNNEKDDKEKIEKKMMGFSKTHLGLRQLNNLVVERFLLNGISVVGIPPCTTGFIDKNGWSNTHALIIINKLLNQNIIPVLHGDVIFNDLQNISVISGDVIIKDLASLFRPKRVIFLCDVEGVYKNMKDKILLDKINVSNQNFNIENQIEIETVEKDVTGGILTKIKNSVLIAKMGIDVYIVKAGTEYSKQAILCQNVSKGTKITNI